MQRHYSRGIDLLGLASRSQSIWSSSHSTSTSVLCLSQQYATSTSSPSPSPPDGTHPAIRWVFLGAPGVGKGTYASRAAKHFGVAHIATGDLIRAEIKAGSAFGKQVWGGS